MPWPSYQSSFTRSPRLPRKANSAPEWGLCSRTCCVITARPSNPLRMSVAPQARKIRVDGGSGIIASGRRSHATGPRHQPRHPLSPLCLKAALSRSSRGPAVLWEQATLAARRSGPRRRLARSACELRQAHRTSPAVAMCRSSRCQHRGAQRPCECSHLGQMHPAIPPASAPPSSADDPTPDQRPRSDYSYDYSYDYSPVRLLNPRSRPTHATSLKEPRSSRRMDTPQPPHQPPLTERKPSHALLQRAKEYS